MPHTPTVAFVDGQIVPFAEASIPLDDRGLLFGESLYEGLPVVGGRGRLLEPHVARMRRGAETIGIDAGDRLNVAAWEAMARDLAAAENVDEGMLYLQLTGGSARRAHLPATRPEPRLFAYLLAARFPRADETAAGVTVTLVPETRWARRDLKTTMLLPAVLAKRAAAALGADEALFVDADGTVSEGASTNVFAVIEGTVCTPPLSADLLPGVTRALTLDLARGQGLDTDERALRAQDLRQADEVFVSATTRLAMPVRALDGQPVGDPDAPVTRRLAAAMRKELGLA